MTKKVRAGRVYRGPLLDPYSSFLVSVTVKPHGRRRGLRPLRKRLTTGQLVSRQYKIDFRREQKALAKIISRRAARKGATK